MSILLFAIIHILIGLALIYFYKKSRKALTVFTSVFLIMSFLYWGTVLMRFVVKLKGAIVEEAAEYSLPLAINFQKYFL